MRESPTRDTQSLSSVDGKQATKAREGWVRKGGSTDPPPKKREKNLELTSEIAHVAYVGQVSK